VASVAPAHGAKGMALGTRGTRPCDRAQRLRTRPAKATHVVCVDAAGPWGSWRSRELRTTGDNGWVVAPAVIAQTPAERVPTDRRDALPLARRARSPWARSPRSQRKPSGSARARAETRSDLQDAKCRRNACGLRPARRDPGRAPGPPAHLR
jgi:hypothetical protein